MNSIESLRLQIIDNNDHSQKQQVDDEIETQVPEFPDDADSDPWIKVMDRPDMSNNAQIFLSTATHITPVTMNKVPKFAKVVKDKASEIGCIDPISCPMWW